MPFLSTYRDLDIVEDLFVKMITDEFDPLPQTLAEMRSLLIEELLRERIKRNFKAWPTNPEFGKKVITLITDACIQYLREHPQTTAFDIDLRKEINLYGQAT